MVKYGGKNKLRKYLTILTVCILILPITNIVPSKSIVKNDLITTSNESFSDPAFSSTVVTNKVYLNYTTPSGGLMQDDATAEGVTVFRPRVEIDKQLVDPKASYDVGDPVKYQIYVHANDNADANVTITDIVPSGVLYDD